MVTTAIVVVLVILAYGAGCGVTWVVLPDNGPSVNAKALVVTFTWPVLLPAVLAARATRRYLARREQEARIEEERAAFVERQYRELMTEEFGEAQVEKRET